MWSARSLGVHENHHELDGLIRAYCEAQGMTYLRDDGEQHRSAFGEPPIVCNYFYHEEVRKSVKKGLETSRA